MNIYKVSNMNLCVLPETLAVCRFEPEYRFDADLSAVPFYSLTKTKDELSVVLPEAHVPDGCRVELGWRALKVEGVLDFSLTGILASLANPLAEAGVSLFAISTYDTDYILVKADDLRAAISTLLDAGHHITE